MAQIKQEILANLDDLRGKVNFKVSTPQSVWLTSEYFSEETGIRYLLSVQLIVEMRMIEELIAIKDISIEGIFFTQDDGKDTDFKFSVEELTEYIDW